MVKVASENKSRKLIFPRILILQNKKHRKGANHSEKIVVGSFKITKQKTSLHEHLDYENK
ncbi:MAG: hypothetical protein ACLTAV_04340 [Finegoldia magna]|nr:hypothetical protein [Finegoldia magna]